MKNIKIYMVCMLCFSMACTKDKGDPCQDYEFEFDYEYINEDNVSNSNTIFGKNVYTTVANDDCAEIYSDAATGKRWQTQDVNPGESLRQRIKVRLPGRELVVNYPGADELTVGPNDLLKVIETDYHEYTVTVISAGGTGGGTGGVGGNNNTNNNNNNTNNNNNPNKTTSVQFKLAGEKAGINIQCLLPLTIEVIEGGPYVGKPCQYGENCYPCGAGFKLGITNPGKSYGRKTINLNKSGEVACGAGGVAAFNLKPGKYTYIAESKACVYYPYEKMHSKGFRFGGILSVTDRDLDKDCKTITLSIGPLHSYSEELKWLRDNCK